MAELSIVIHLFYFDNGVWVKWFPVEKDGKAHGLFTVVIEFPPTESGSDIERSERHGPPSAATSLHLLRWAIKDRKNKS